MSSVLDYKGVTMGSKHDFKKKAANFELLWK